MSSNETAEYILKGEEEMARLSSNHFIYKDALGTLLLPPINVLGKPLRILDSATADGTNFDSICNIEQERTLFLIRPNIAFDPLFVLHFS